MSTPPGIEGRLGDRGLPVRLVFESGTSKRGPPGEWDMSGSDRVSSGEDSSEPDVLPGRDEFPGFKGVLVRGKTKLLPA